MFRVICTKEGRQYVPDQDVRDVEFLIYYKTFMATKEMDDFHNRPESRIEIEFKDDNETGQKEVHHRLINCPDNFKNKFYELYEKV